MNQAGLQNLLNYIEGLNLSLRNRKWLARKLLELNEKEKIANKS